jgi:hypothetical protein
MCYESLVDGDVDRSIGDLLRDEAPDALLNGVVAALVVLGGLLVQGVGPGLAVPFAIGGLVLAALLHQAVLLVGVGLLRGHGRVRDRTATRPAETSG